MFGEFDTVALKHHFGKKLMELEDEKRIVQVDEIFFIHFFLWSILWPSIVLISFCVLVTTTTARERPVTSRS